MTWPDLPHLKRPNIGPAGRCSMHGAPLRSDVRSDGFDRPGPLGHQAFIDHRAAQRDVGPQPLVNHPSQACDQPSAACPPRRALRRRRRRVRIQILLDSAPVANHSRRRSHDTMRPQLVFRTSRTGFGSHSGREARDVVAAAACSTTTRLLIRVLGDANRWLSSSTVGDPARGAMRSRRASAS